MRKELLNLSGEILVPMTIAGEHMSPPVSYSTLRSWRTRGQYPDLFIELGGRIYVDLERWDGIVAEARQGKK